VGGWKSCAKQEHNCIPARKDGMAAPQPWPTRSSMNADGLKRRYVEVGKNHRAPEKNMAHLDAHALAEVAGYARANIAGAGANHESVKFADVYPPLRRFQTIISSGTKSCNLTCERAFWRALAPREGACCLREF
jgi:hypothetical protein